MDFFRRIDKDQDGKITRQEFIDGILASSTKLQWFRFVYIVVLFYISKTVNIISDILRISNQ